MPPHFRPGPAHRSSFEAHSWRALSPRHPTPVLAPSTGYAPKPTAGSPHHLPTPIPSWHRPPIILRSPQLVGPATPLPSRHRPLAVLQSPQLAAPATSPPHFQAISFSPVWPAAPNHFFCMSDDLTGVRNNGNSNTNLQSPVTRASVRCILPAVARASNTTPPLRAITVCMEWSIYL